KEGGIAMNARGKFLPLLFILFFFFLSGQVLAQITTEQGSGSKNDVMDREPLLPEGSATIESDSSVDLSAQ
ncbi:MAG: hypothetical protein KJ645_11020, partial [Planctomycetes bacterium]|nr:hypothetical protein [Planctomycetota bacterium]